MDRTKKGSARMHILGHLQIFGKNIGNNMIRSNDCGRDAICFVHLPR